MEPQVYDEIALQENIHWWFRARTAIVASLFRGLRFPSSDVRILDAGCGAGGNLPLLAQFGEVHAFEMHEASRKHAENRAIAKVDAGSLPDAIPFSGIDFDLITLFDVLEHVEDDVAALDKLFSRLKPGGFLFLSVPAFAFLFGPVDVMHHHFRRYGFKELQQKVEAAGFEIQLINYWNFLLFPVAVLARLIERIRRPSGLSMGAKIPPVLINDSLSAVVSAERFVLPYVRLPFGLSLLLVARKPF